VIVDASARKGPAYARNFGVSCSFADAFIFCDADDVVAPGWLEGLGKALLKYDVVVSRFKSFSTNHVLGIKEFEDGVQSKEIQKLWFSPYCLHASSCGLGVKREVHEKVNGFDEMIPALEDTDYCIRIQRSGFDLHFVPEAVVYYRLRSDFKALLKQRRLWRFCCMMLYKKYRLSSPTISEQVRMWRAFFFSIFTLMVRLFTIANRQKRVVFVRKLGNLLGQIQGIIKCRVPPV
jgi:GT2 family glycosyltransferase